MRRGETERGVTVIEERSDASADHDEETATAVRGAVRPPRVTNAVSDPQAHRSQIERRHGRQRVSRRPRLGHSPRDPRATSTFDEDAERLPRRSLLAISRERICET